MGQAGREIIFEDKTQNTHQISINHLNSFDCSAWSKHRSLCLLSLNNALHIRTATGNTALLLGKKCNELLNSALYEFLSPIPSWENGENETGDFRAVSFVTGRVVQGFWSRNALEIQLILVQLGEAKSQVVESESLAMAITHEIRNPLASIKMVVQTLAQSCNIDERSNKRLVIANREIRTIERVLSALSVLYRSSSPTYKLTKPAQILEQAIQELHREDENDFFRLHTRLHTLVDPDLPLLKVDVAQISLALVYLVLQILRWNEHCCLLIVLKKEEHGVAFEIQKSSLTLEQVDLVSHHRLISIAFAMVRKIIQEHGGSLSIHSDEKQFFYRLFLPASE